MLLLIVTLDKHENQVLISPGVKVMASNNVPPLVALLPVSSFVMPGKLLWWLLIYKTDFHMTSRALALRAQWKSACIQDQLLVCTSSCKMTHIASKMWHFLALEIWYDSKVIKRGNTVCTYCVTYGIAQSSHGSEGVMNANLRLPQTLKLFIKPCKDQFPAKTFHLKTYFYDKF